MNINCLGFSGRKVILISALVFFVGCTSLSKLSSKEEELRSEKDFESALAINYLEYSKVQKENHDRSGSRYFANKGLKIYDNKFIYPEEPVEWGIDENNDAKIVDARKRLMYLFENTYVRETKPIDLAKATFLYDCWVEREAKHYSEEKTGECKTPFYPKLEELEGYLAFKQKEILDAEKEKETKKDYIPDVDIYGERPFEIYFDFDSYKLNTQGVKEVIKILKRLEKMEGNYTLLVEGHADRVGKKLYNDVLARKRALNVKSRLVKNGVPEDLIEVKVYGESNPKIITKDNTKEQSNRRVSVYIKKGKELEPPLPLPLD